MRIRAVLAVLAVAFIISAGCDDHYSPPPSASRRPAQVQVAPGPARPGYAAAPTPTYGGGYAPTYGGGYVQPAPTQSFPAMAPQTTVPVDSGGMALFRLPDDSGRTVTVKTPAALFFFTSWCHYCKDVMPDIKRLVPYARQRGWWVYGIDVKEGAAQAQQVIMSYQPNFPVLLDSQGVISKQYNVSGFPTFVLIDRNGNVIYNDHSLPSGRF